MTGDPVLRPPVPSDEAAVDAADAELAAEGWTFALDRDRATDFAAWCDLMAAQADGRDLAPDRVRASFLLAEVDGEVIGRVSVRHELNDFLRREGGHIGYGVRPAHRRRGYATAILRRSLTLLAAEGVAEALVTCDDDNLASAVVIERCGGQLRDTIDIDGTPVRRYDVPTGA